MNIITKLILPLVDTGFSSIFFKKENCFVDAYLKDINRPYLDHHIMLMYSDEVQPFIDTLLTSLPTYFSKYKLRIDYIYYVVYTFIRDINHPSDIGIILNGGTNVSSGSAMEIIYFSADLDVFNYIHYKLKITETKKDTIPIEDYVPEISIDFDLSIV